MDLAHVCRTISSDGISHRLPSLWVVGPNAVSANIARRTSEATEVLSSTLSAAFTALGTTLYVGPVDRVEPHAPQLRAGLERAFATLQDDVQRAVVHAFSPQAAEGASNRVPSRPPLGPAPLRTKQTTLHEMIMDDDDAA